MTYERKPFFLRGSQENIDRELRSLGLPPDAPRSEITKARVKKGEFTQERIDHMDVLYRNAGLSPDKSVISPHVQMSDTMNSQRLGRWAASISPQKGEAMWRATSRRYFEGKDTLVRPIRLDSRELLLECVAVAGLDVEEAKGVLDSDLHRVEIEEEVEEMHAVGINSIPVLVFEVDGVTRGSWLRDPRVSDRAADLDPGVLAKMAVQNPNFSRTREINHGSGSPDDFKTILKRLHTACCAAL